MNTRSLSATLSLVLTCGLTQAAKDDGPVCDCNSTINDFFFTTYRAGLWISECPEVFCDMPFTNFTAARIGEVGWTGNCIVTDLILYTLHDDAMSDGCVGAMASPGFAFGATWTTDEEEEFWAILLQGYGEFEYVCDRETDVYRIMAGSAYASTCFYLSPGMDAEWRFALPDPDTTNYVARPGSIARQAFFASGISPIGRLGAGTKTIPIGGLTYANGEWTVSVPLTAPGWVDASASVISFVDSDLDTNDDGRFNEHDPAALVPHYGSVTTANARFDLDADEDVDASDRTLMEDLIAAGFGSGVFGDSNGDSTINCSDLCSTCDFGYSLGDAEYRIELDADLDGDTDNDDLAAFIWEVPNPDMNDDFALDGFDVECLEEAIGGPTSCTIYNPDYNRDFALDGFDVEALEYDIGNGCP